MRLRDEPHSEQANFQSNRQLLGGKSRRQMEEEAKTVGTTSLK
jgi:hypothetical protein